MLQLYLTILSIILLLAIAIKVFFMTKNEAITQVIKEQNFNNQKDLNEVFNTFTDRMDQRLHDLQERNARMETSTTKDLVSFQDKMNKVMQTQFKDLQTIIERRLTFIDQKVSESLEQGFNKTNETFTNIVERLSKIDEAQKKIDSLSVEIVSLQDVLTDKKTRGVFGEVQLNQILSSIFGDKNDKVYQTQYRFSTGVYADAVLFAPEPLGTVVIDSKFPLENFRKMTNKELSQYDRSEAEKAFNADCKKHIDDIAKKYIIGNETSNQAFMFIPAEAVFAMISAYHEEILIYAQNKNVWLVSPTTLMSTLTTVQAVLINMQRDEYAEQIHQHLESLAIEFDRYRKRWDKLSRNIDTVNNSVKDIHITTDKITKRFDDISSGEIDKR